jgi:pSer/pThr/pTyr-binding forkhead associated (FHA) protein
MSAPVVLVLRLFLAASLYAFLILALLTLWRENKIQGTSLASRKAPPLSIKFITADLGSVQQNFNQPEILLGRDTHCDVPLSDETVSVRHARLSFHHGQWWLEDLGSTNGTRLNTERVTIPTVVIGGDQVECGAVQLSLNIGLDLEPSATQRIEPKGDPGE